MADRCRIPLPSDQDDLLRSLQVRAFYELLSTGEPVPQDRVMPPGASDDELEQTRGMIRDLRDLGRMTVADDGRIAGSLGLTTAASPHRIELGEGVRHTWCAVDAVGILSSLERSGRIWSLVPDGPEPIHVEFRDGAIHEAPDQAVIVIPAEPTGPVVATWCPLANIFPDPERARSWAVHHDIDDFTLMDLPSATRMAGSLWKSTLEG